MKNIYKNYIYGLRDPRNDTYRYIGKTSVGDDRPLVHLKESHNSSVNEWVSELNKQGLEPFIDVIEKVDDINDLSDRERFYIAYYSNTQGMLLNGNRDKYNSINSPSTATREQINTTYLCMLNMGEVYKILKISTNFKDDLLGYMFGVGRRTISNLKNSNTEVMFLTYLKLIFFAHIGIDGFYDFYYSKSNEFKGDYPDTKNDFINRCLIDYDFCKYWFNKCFKEKSLLNKTEYNKRSSRKIN